MTLATNAMQNENVGGKNGINSTTATMTANCWNISM